MPRIPEYDAPQAQVDLTPSSAGFSALETAGRRLGPAYQQAAGDYEKMGKVAGAMLDEGRGVLEFDRFRMESGSSGGGLRVKGLNNDSPGHTRASAQAARAAPRLAQTARDLVAQQSPLASARQKMIAQNAKETETAQQALINQQHEIEANANKASWGSEGQSVDTLGNVQDTSGRLYTGNYNTDTGNVETGQPGNNATRSLPTFMNDIGGGGILSTVLGGLVSDQMTGME